jgi:hypothetical protein
MVVQDISNLSPEERRMLRKNVMAITRQLKGISLGITKNLCEILSIRPKKEEKTPEEEKVLEKEIEGSMGTEPGTVGEGPKIDTTHVEKHELPLSEPPQEESPSQSEASPEISDSDKPPQIKFKIKFNLDKISTKSLKGFLVECDVFGYLTRSITSDYDFKKVDGAKLNDKLSVKELSKYIFIHKSRVKKFLKRYENYFGNPFERKNIVKKEVIIQIYKFLTFYEKYLENKTYVLKSFFEERNLGIDKLAKKDEVKLNGLIKCASMIDSEAIPVIR